MHDVTRSSSSSSSNAVVVVVSLDAVVVTSPAAVRGAAPASHLHRRHGHVVGVFALVASSAPTHLEVSAGFGDVSNATSLLSSAAASSVSASVPSSLTSVVLEYVSSAVD